MNKEYRFNLVYLRGKGNDISVWNALTELHAKSVKYNRTKACVVFSFSGTMDLYHKISIIADQMDLSATIEIKESVKV